MDLPAILSTVSTVGFPCAMCIVLLVQMQNQTKMHRDELTTLTKYLNENTLSVQKLTDKLEAHYENVRTRYISDKEI